MADNAPTALFEDAKLIYKNFAGKKGMYNVEGQRSFSVIIPSLETAQQMEEDGWNVKWPKPREMEEGEEDTRMPHLPVAVRYDFFPPRIVLISDKSRTNVNEEMVETVDWVNIQTADLIVRGSTWEVNGKKGLKAYLKSLFITIDEDYLERKYSVNEAQING